MEERLPRKLAAILYADVAGYSRLTGEDEDATHRALRDYLDVFAAAIESQNGQVMHYAGDAVLAQFRAVLDAVSSAVVIQKELRTRNEGIPDDRQIRFRIGINLGDVIEDRGDIYGDGVNVAARLEALAEPGSICISDSVRTAIGKKLPFEYAFIGEHSVKNIKEPVRAYRIYEGGEGPDSSPATSASGPTVVPQALGKLSIAIKPFTATGTDPEQEQLADGLTNGISTALFRVPSLIIIGDDSPGLTDTKQMTTEKLGRRLHVKYVLKGHVRKYGERIRVNVELIEASTGRVHWGDQLDRELHDFGDYFDIQDEITEEIVTALNVKLLAGEAARIVRRVLKDPSALEHYYRGEDLLWRATMKLEFQEAQRLFEETIRLQPESPVGYAAAALTYWVEALSGLSENPSSTLERAAERAEKAISLDDVTGYAHMVMAYVHLYRREYDEAMAEVTRTVIDRPSCPASYALKANVLNYVGQSEDAIEFAQYATQLSPLYPPMFPAILASAFYGAGHFEEAVAAARAAMELDDKKIEPYLMLAAANMALGNVGDAHLATKRVRDLEPNFDLSEFASSQPYREQEHLDLLLDHLRGAGLQ